jgi:hypothetical protein
MKKIGGIILILLGLLVLSQTTEAAYVTMLGPKKYLRTSGKTNLFQEQFAARAGSGAFLEVNNGTLEGTGRVTSAKIMLNGKQILGPDRFKQSVANIQIPVNLAEQNKLAVRLDSKPGSFLSLRITQDNNFREETPAWDMPDPAVTALAASPDRCDPENLVTLRATVMNQGEGDSPAAALSFLVDGAEVARTPVPPLAPQGQAEVRANWTAQGPGRHAVVAQLQLPPGVFDASTSNNTATATVRVSGKTNPTPELEFSAAAFDHWPLSPGESCTVTFTARNPGFAELRNIYVQLYIDGVLAPAYPVEPGPVEAQRTVQTAAAPLTEDRINNDRERLAGVLIPYLGPGDSIPVQFPWNSLTTGEHILTVRLFNVPDFFPQELLLKTWSAMVQEEPTVIYDPFFTYLPGKWISMGPAVINTGYVGRMDCLAFDCLNPNTIYAGAPTGGLWKSTHGGIGWSPLRDKSHWLKVSAVAVDPFHPQIIYCTTGAWYEKLTAADAPIFKSIDGGQHWYIFAAGVGQGWKNLLIRYTAGGGHMVYAAGNRGVFRYQNLDPYRISSNPSEWQQILPGTIGDLAVHPQNNSVMYAITYAWITRNGQEVLVPELLLRTNNGENGTQGIKDWAPLLGLPINSLDKESAFLDIFQADPQKLYAAVRTPPPPGIDLGRVDFYFSPDGGNTWKFQFGRGDSFKGEFYLPYLRVHPKKEWLYYGGVHFFKSNKITPNVPTNDTYWVHQRIPDVHDDMKEMVFNPNDPYTYYNLNDGGVYLGTIDQATGFDKCFPRNYNLRTTMFYDFDISQTNPNLMIGGTQDNGTILFEGNPLEWREVRGGDGLFSLLAPSNNQFWYSQTQSLLSTRRSSDAGKTWLPPKDDDITGLATDLVMDDAYITADPLNSNLILAAGDEVQASWDGGKTWEQRGPKAGPVKKGWVRRVVIQPGTRHWIAGTTAEGQIWHSTSSGSPWTLIDYHPDPGAAVVNMAFAPSNPNVLLVIYENCDPYRRLQRLEKNAYGQWDGSWITDDLPSKYLPTGAAVKINCIAGDSLNDNVAYVGTDKGVYRGQTSPDSSMWHWAPYNDGFPLVRVTDLITVTSRNELRAATYGRGIWCVPTFAPGPD